MPQSDEGFDNGWRANWPKRWHVHKKQMSIVKLNFFRRSSQSDFLHDTTSGEAASTAQTCERRSRLGGATKGRQDFSDLP
jgi:hypothetical protein